MRKGRNGFASAAGFASTGGDEGLVMLINCGGVQSHNCRAPKLILGVMDLCLQCPVAAGVTRHLAPDSYEKRAHGYHDATRRAEARYGARKWEWE